MCKRLDVLTNCILKIPGLNLKIVEPSKTF